MEKLQNLGWNPRPNEISRSITINFNGEKNSVLELN